LSVPANGTLEYRQVFQIAQIGGRLEVRWLDESCEHALFGHDFRDRPSSGAQARLKMRTRQNFLQFRE
jgi:hypothetical protein